MADKIKVVHVSDAATTYYECEQVEPYGIKIAMLNAVVTKIETNFISLTGLIKHTTTPNPADAPSRVFLLSGQVRVYGVLRVSMGGSVPRGTAQPV